MANFCADARVSASKLSQIAKILVLPEGIELSTSPLPTARL
jgi:hypothetical protein